MHDVAAQTARAARVWPAAGSIIAGRGVLGDGSEGTMRVWPNRIGPILAALMVVSATPVAAQNPETRLIRPSEIVVLGGSVFRVGDELYQVAGIRTPRPRRGRCLLERRRGREARSALRRLLRRGEIRVIPTGQIGAGGARLAQVTVDRQDLAQRLIERRFAVSRQGPEGRNPWCLNLR